MPVEPFVSMNQVLVHSLFVMATSERCATAHNSEGVAKRRPAVAHV